MNYYKIGQRIRQIRKSRGLSQEELAEKINISTTHMSHIETGNTKLSLQVFVDIASVLQVKADELLQDQLPESHASSLEEIASVLNACSVQEANVISDVVKAVKQSMDKNL